MELYGTGYWILYGIVIGIGGTIVIGFLWLNHWLKKYDLVPTKKELERREKELNKKLNL